MKVTGAVRFLDRLAAKASKKEASDGQLLVIEWNTAGVLMLHLDVTAGPKIIRFSRASFEADTTDAEKKNALSQFISSIPGKSRPRAALCWSEGMTFRQLSLPPMPPEDLLKAIEWDLKKKYFFIPEDNFYGYQEVMTVDGEEAPEKLYSLFYCDSKTATARLETVSSLGLEVRAITPGPAALAGLMAAEDALSEKDILVCDLSAGLARILVTHGRHCMLVRNVAFSPTSTALSEADLDRITEEIRKTIEFYEAQKYARPIGKVVVTGERCEPMRVLDYITTRLPVPVTVQAIEPFLSGGMDLSDKELAMAAPGLFSTALGAALEPDETLNLVPTEIKTKNRQGKLNRLLNLGVFVLAVCLAIFVGLTVVRMNWTKAHIIVLRKEYEKLNENKLVLEQMLARSRVRRTTLKGDVPVYALLKDLSNRTPGTIILKQLQFSRLDGTLVIIGDVTDAKREPAKTLGQFLVSLGESVFFKSATITSSAPAEENKILNFQLEVGVKGLSV